MGDKYKEYIHFFSLRAHSIINSVPKTEIIYIHSKVSRFELSSYLLIYIQIIYNINDSIIDDNS